MENNPNALAVKDLVTSVYSMSFTSFVCLP